MKSLAKSILVFADSSRKFGGLAAKLMGQKAPSVSYPRNTVPPGLEVGGKKFQFVTEEIK